MGVMIKMADKRKRKVKINQKKNNILDTAKAFLKYREAKKLMFEINEDLDSNWELKIIEKPSSYEERKLSITWRGYGIIDKTELAKVLKRLMEISVKYSISIFGYNSFYEGDNELELHIRIR